VLGPGETGPGIEWLQRALGQLGLLPESPSGWFDGKTELAVRAFQRGRGLDEDGMVGPRTKMALYDALGRYVIPRSVTTRRSG